MNKKKWFNSKKEIEKNIYANHNNNSNQNK